MKMIDLNRVQQNKIVKKFDKLQTNFFFFQKTTTIILFKIQIHLNQSQIMLVNQIFSPFCNRRFVLETLNNSVKRKEKKKKTI